jgi:hypothetical protein
MPFMCGSSEPGGSRSDVPNQADIVGSLSWKRTRNVARPPGRSGPDQAVAGTSGATRASAPLPVSAQARIGAMSSHVQTGRARPPYRGGRL